jgi:uncharacterized membrane protein
VATKFYPLMFFGALLLLCLRAGKLREFGKALAGAVIAWLVINLPVALTATSGWAEFYAFSRSRGADWGSVWYMFEHFNVPVLGNPQLSALNKLTEVFFAVACAAIAVLALAAPRRPRLFQLCFLLLASFLILNKVWSPQYVIWLVPLAVLARPKVWAYALWQIAEIIYFFGIWGYFVNMYAAPSGITAGWYFIILALRLLTLAVLASTVVVDILQPERDRVRASGVNDDPAGGVLDGAPDRLSIGASRCRRPGPFRESRRPPGRRPRGLRRGAPAGRSFLTRSSRAGPRPSRTGRVSCCNVRGRSGR